MTTLQKLEVKRQLQPLLSAAGFKQDTYGNWKREVIMSDRTKLQRIKFNDNVIRIEKAYHNREGWFKIASYSYSGIDDLVRSLNRWATEVKGITRASIEAMNKGPVKALEQPVPNREKQLYGALWKLV